MTRWLAAIVVLALAGPAAAQSNFVPPEDEPEDPKDTKYKGHLTLSTLGFRESGQLGTPFIDGMARPETAGLNRLFADVRALVDAAHISGGDWDARLDARVRQIVGGVETSVVTNPDAVDYDTIPIQSGTFGDAEYDVRELWARRRGKKTDLYIGRQFVLEIGAFKIDGVRVEHRASRKWTYLGFAGAYPQRSSRSVTDDYVEVADGMATKRIIPVIGAVGAAYRFDDLYGSVGGGAILPRGNDETGLAERTRIFASSQGYWRSSPKLDLYHYAVFDVEGSAGTGFSLLTVGADYHPRHTFRLTAQVMRMNTETLTVTALDRLETPDGNGGNLVQNGIEVTRIASDAARLGLSVGLKDSRFEVSVHGTVRRRPEITVPTSNGMTFTFPASQAADVSFDVIDRRSFKDFRFGLHLTQTFGFGGDANLAKSSSRVARLSARRLFRDGDDELEVDLTYLTAEDDLAGSGGTECELPANNSSPLVCYGTSSVRTFALGGLLFHRINTQWFAVGSLYAAQQRLTVDNAMAARVEQPSTLMLTAFARVSYRF